MMRQTIRSRDVASKVERRHPLSSMLVALVAAIATLFGSMMMTAPASASELQVSQQQMEAEAAKLGSPEVSKQVIATNTDGDFDLNLSVKGKGKEIKQTQPVDVVLMLDRSYRMSEADMVKMKTTAKDFVRKSLALNGSEASNKDLVRMKVSSFASSTNTYTQFTSDSNQLLGAINLINDALVSFSRWDLAFQSVKEQMGSMRKDATKVVVFMTGTEPNGNLWNGGSDTAVYNTAKNYGKQVAGAADRLLNIGINPTPALSSRLNDFTGYIGGSAQKLAADSGAMYYALSKVLQYKTGKYVHSNVTITDTLSKYVKFANGNTTKVELATSDGSRPSYTAKIVGKQLTISFADGVTLTPGTKYTFKVKIRATDDAYAASQYPSGYPNKADANTGTWSGQKGVYTNDSANSKVSYKVKLVMSGAGHVVPGGTVPLPKPVIQVTPKAAKLSLSGMKKIDKNKNVNYQLKAGAFKVRLTGTDSKGKPVSLKTTNDKNGKFTFDSLSFDKAGTYTYKISEILPENVSKNNVSGGILYDTETKEVKVEVKLAGNKFEVVKINGSANRLFSFEFKNVALEKAKTAFSATKLVINNNEDGVALDGFEFGLYEKKSTEKPSDASMDRSRPIQTKKASKTGEITFDTIKYDQDGTYEYAVCEIIPEKAENLKGSEHKYYNGILYDTSCANITVTVKLGNNKNLVITKVTGNNHTFRNVRIRPIDLKGLKVTKSIEGRDLVEGEFSFEVVDKDNKVVATGTNAADGTVKFTSKLPKASDTGTYEYTIREIIPNKDDDAYDAAITYDDSTPTVKFTVALNYNAKNPGKSVFKITEKPEPVEFKNVYTAPGSDLCELRRDEGP